ncbi:hypothetical protein QWY82_02330 [Simiduia curdlanivorans]|uniref:Uncharacterized protein n=1 Tax=Simiduia curdlanivorans TaxID=1492769 RepID=A0ABV8V0X9_9GAMM|nr:hypothetical protein [Simiduia curdlanivorans]MDN3637636.1 hypothetical protein [Simiduia curdlanivorans]
MTKQNNNMDQQPEQAPSALSRRLNALLRRNHPFAFTAALALLMLLTCGWQLHRYLDQQLNNVAQRYGQAMANMAAEQAEPAMLNQDRVSLTALLADIGENLNVAGATIHDVENRLLVQNGSLNALQPSSKLLQFSAPIVLQDSVAGYVTVAIDATEALDNRYRLYGRILLTGLALLALAGTAAMLYRQENPSQSTPEPQLKPVLPSNIRKVKLTLDLLNLEQLHTELNAEAFKRLLSKFESQLQGVMSLYGGESLGLQNHQLTLVFADEVRSEASLKAICSAELLHALSEKSDLAIQLGARILPFEASANLRSQYTRQLKPGGMRATIISVKLLDEALTERCQFTARADQRSARVEQMLPPYRKLLDNQLSQLASIVA